MEPLFLAVICGCKAGLFREALNEVYIPRIQRGKACFAANVLGSRGSLLSVLAHFFERGRWDAPVEMGEQEHSLSTEDQLFILMQAGQYLTATRGFASAEVRVCYQRVESLCHSLNRPLPISVLTSQWLYSLFTDTVRRAAQIAERIYSAAEQKNDATLTIGAYRALGASYYYLGDFETARHYAVCGIEIWRSVDVPYQVEQVTAPAIVCLYYGALSEWHLGEIASCKVTMAEAISLAKELNDVHGLAASLFFACFLSQFERNPAEVDRLVSEVIELSSRQNFALWLAGGEILRGAARSVSGNTAEGIAWIEDGIRDYRATGAMLRMPYFLALKAEALYFAGRVSEALEAITEAEGAVERSEERWWYADIQRLRGVFLAAMDADETQIEALFCAAIRIAKEQKSVSLN
jgi:tetratricopeptide (TPR) repeat protein